MSLGEESPSDNILSLHDVQLHLRSTDNGTLIFSPQPYIPGLLHRDQVVCSSETIKLNICFSFVFTGCHNEFPACPTRPRIRVFSIKPSRKMCDSLTLPAEHHAVL